MSFSCLMSCFRKDDPIHLERCLDSIVQQTLSATEVVFVKDGSLTEELESVLQKFSSSIPFKFLTFEENKGLGYALNKGLEACSFDIVIRMDTDDICYPDRFEVQYNYLRQNPDVDILGGWAYDIDANDNIIGERKYPTEYAEIRKLMWTNPLIHPAIAFRKNRIIEVGSYDPLVIRRQDYDLWIRAAAAGLKIENLSKFLIKYRFTDNYYKKNGLKVAYKQALMGYHGAKVLKLPLYTRVAVFVPVLRTLLPIWLVKPLHKLISKFDPRK